MVEWIRIFDLQQLPLSEIGASIIAHGAYLRANRCFFAAMPSSSPLVSSPKPVSSSSSVSTRPRRLVKPLRRARDLEQERARRIAFMRGRKRLRHARTLGLVMGIPLLALAVGVGARVWASSGPNWPSGVQLSGAVPSERAPVFVGAAWLLAGSDGSVWRADNQRSAAQKVWSNAFPASPHIVALPGGAVVAGGDGTLARLDGRGRTLWSVQNGGVTSSRPVVSRNGANLVLVGGDDSGRIWARDARSGQPLWSQNTNTSLGEGLAATPWGVVAPFLGNSSSRGGLRCFSTQNGQEKWRFPVSPRSRAAGTATPRFDAATNRVFWCNDEGAVVSLDGATGRKIWKTFVSRRGGTRDTVFAPRVPGFRWPAGVRRWRRWRTSRLGRPHWAPVMDALAG